MASTAIETIQLPEIIANRFADDNDPDYLTVLGLYNNIRPFVALIAAVNAADIGTHERTAAVNALKASQIKTVNLSSVRPGGSRKNRQSKKRKNHRNHSNNKQ